MNDPFIKFRGIHKAFGDKLVLRGLDLGVGRGETVIVLGGSGSGKSVLLRHTITLVERLRNLGADIYFEWPRYCDGWSAALCPPVSQLQRLLPFQASVDGCSLSWG